MNHTDELADLLAQAALKVETWQAQAAQLRLLVDAARVSQSVGDDLLHSVEETSGAVYAEIATFNRMAEEMSDAAPEAAQQFVSASDRLHLVLLEITELGTALYAVRSQLGFVAEALIAPPGRA